MNAIALQSSKTQMLRRAIIIDLKSKGYTSQKSDTIIKGYGSNHHTNNAIFIDLATKRHVLQKLHHNYRGTCFVSPSKKKKESSDRILILQSINKDIKLTKVPKNLIFGMW